MLVWGNKKKLIKWEVICNQLVKMIVLWERLLGKFVYQMPLLLEFARLRNYLPANYSLLFILFTRALAHTAHRRSHKSKFHFNVLTKDQIKHFNWHFYGGQQPKPNSCLLAWADPVRLLYTRIYKRTEGGSNTLSICIIHLT